MPTGDNSKGPNKRKTSAKQRAAAKKNIAKARQVQDKRINDLKEQQLDIQQKINIELEKEWMLGDKLTRSERKHAENLQQQLEARIQTTTGLGRKNQLTKEQQSLLKDELGVLQKIAKGGKSALSLQRDLLKIHQEIFDMEEGDAKESKKRQAAMLNHEIKFRKVTELKAKKAKEFKESMNAAFPISKKIFNTLKALATNPMVAMVAAIALLLKTFTDFSNQVDQVGKSFGALGVQSKEVRRTLGQILRDGISLDISMQQLSAVMPSIASNFGSSMVDSMKLADNAVRLGMALGTSSGESVQLLNIFKNIHGLSAELAIDAVKQQAAFAKTQGVVPAAIVKDMAGSTEFIAKQSNATTENILNAAIAANKLGNSLKSVEGMSSSLLDFQSSIRNEFEISALLGRRVNLTEARGLMLSGKKAEGYKAVVEQLKGIDVNTLDPLTFNKLAEATGLQAEELRKSVNNASNLNNVMSATGATLNNMDTSKLTAEDAVTSLTKGRNELKNFGRGVNEDIVDGFDSAEGAIDGMRASLDGVRSVVKGLGIVLSAAVVSMVALVAWGTKFAVQMARASMELQRAQYMGAQTSRGRFAGKGGGAYPVSGPMSNLYSGWGAGGQGSSSHLFGGGPQVFQHKSGRYSVRGAGVKGSFGSMEQAQSAISKKMGGGARGGRMLGARGGMYGTAAMLGMMALSGGMPKGGAETGGLLGSLGGGGIGAAIGSAIAPGIGTMIGGFIGSMLGSSAGSSIGGSFHTGTGHVPKDGRYNLKAGEGVIPSQLNNLGALGGISSTMGGSSGGTIKVQIDDESLAKFEKVTVSANKKSNLLSNDTIKMRDSQDKTTSIWAMGIV